MAGGPSVYQANRMLNKSLKGVDYTPPATLYVALFTTSSATELRANNLAAASEVGSGIGYARQSLNPADITTASTGTSIVSVSVDFPLAAAAWGTCYQAALMDAPTLGTGNILFFGPLTSPANVQTGDTFKVPAGTLVVNE